MKTLAAQALIAIALLLVLCPLAILGHRLKAIHALVYGAATLISIHLAGLGVMGLLDGDAIGSAGVTLPIGLPWLRAHFRFDALSALFLVVVNLGTTAASLYGIGYGGHLARPNRVTPIYPLFLAGLNLTLLADDAFVFLIGWEFMSVSSWLLVLADHEKAENREAATTYLVMAVLGSFCLLGAFGVLAMNGEDYSFAAMRGAVLDTVEVTLLVGLVLIGAGSKAGVVPLHAWLPLAHPAAPSHVSALMSGVMTKVALYGLVRILFDLNRQADWEWGALLMLLGAATAVLGILYALMQTDIKRILAYSTVENVGVVLLGLGLALAFRASDEPALAALALAAGFYHVLNHAAMKTLLFLGAGAVVATTAERNIERLGGLIRLMPVTAVTFLIGSAAISALPPLNGFVSEWLILQTLFKAPSLPMWTMKFGAPVAGALLALSAALAAACFVRAFGIVFLGRARSPATLEARDPDPWMRAALVLTAGLCLLLGILPVTVTSMLSDVSQSLIGVDLSESIIQGWPWLAPVSAARGSYSGTVVVASGLLMILVTAIVIKGFGTRKIRRAPAWDCGHVEDNPASQYTASSLAQPLRRVFGTSLFAARETVEMPMPDEIAPARLSVRVIDPVWQGLYAPAIRAVDWLANRINRLQSLTVRRHLLLMFLTLMVMLVLAAIRRMLT
ncbi:MAG: hydrogenase 4 subunit B [Rhodospirillales bacterium]|nr:hydrogenase 4 subunit B [Rhodospirillales bacterium]